MANQPPVRPWFRLASLRSVAAPPAPEPRPSLVQPTIRTNPQPTQPQAQPTPQPPPAPAGRGSAPSPSPSPQKAPAKFPSSSSLPNSPVQKASLTTFSANPSSSSSSLPNSPAQKASLTTFSANPSSSSSSPAKGLSPSTKPVVQSPKQSPKFKPITPPPSPLTLPPSQLKANSEIEPKIPIEAEAKNVIVQNTIKNPNQWHNSNSGETLNLKTYSEKQNGGNQKKISDPEDFGMKVITIAGENRGAYMELIRSPNKHEFVGEKPNYLYKKGKSEWESSSSDEGNANKINRGKSQSSYPMAAFMNSNVQCVNNSILYNASCTHKDPGVRLSLSKKPFEGEGFHFKEVR